MYLEKAETFIDRGSLPQCQDLITKLKFVLDEKLSDHITGSIEEFFQERISKLQKDIRARMDMQLTDWVEDLQNEQERIGNQVRADVESKLSM